MTSVKAIGRVALKKSLAMHARSGPQSERVERGRGEVVAALGALAEQYGLPAVDVTEITVQTSLLGLLPQEIAAAHGVLLFRHDGDQICAAVARPMDCGLLEQLEFATGKRVQQFVGLEEPLAELMSAAYETKARGEEWHRATRALQGPADEDRGTGAHPVGPAPLCVQEDQGGSRYSGRPAGPAAERPHMIVEDAVVESCRRGKER